MLFNGKNVNGPPPAKQNTPGQIKTNVSRVICSNSQEHHRIRNLARMGLSLQAIAAITGLTETEVSRLQ